MTRAAHLLVALERDEDGYPPYDTEELDAVAVGAEQYQVTGAPAFVHGIAPGDVVRAVRAESDDQLWVVSVVRSGDRWLARVVPRGEAGLADVVRRFEDLGCDARPTPFGLVTVVVPPDVPPRELLGVLRDGQDAGRRYFDLGVAPSP